MVRDWTTALLEQRVTFTVELDGRIYLIENVPARVHMETGEQLFSPETVERIQQIVIAGECPLRHVETTVFDYWG